MKTRSLPNVALPRSLHDKYLWRKILERDPRYTTFSDKILCKQYMAEHFPEVKSARLLWQGTDIKLAPAKLLANPGYLKANHASGYNYRLGDTSPDHQALQQLTRRWLRRKWYRIHGEWGYKNIRPRLLIEEDVSLTAPGQQLIDLTVYVFNEVVSHVAVMSDHKTDEARFGRFDALGNRLALCEYPNALMERLARGPDAGEPRELPCDFVLPEGFKDVLQLSRRIANGFDHLRVDFMWNGQSFYFSEITIYSQGGFLLYSDQDLLARMASCWNLRLSWLLTTPQTGWRGIYASWLAKQLDIAEAGS